MRNRTILPQAIGCLLLSACTAIPRAVEQTAPARSDALSCARSSLEQLGFAADSPARADQELTMRRTSEREWVYRVDHVVHVSQQADNGRQLRLEGERLEVKQPGSDASKLNDPYPTGWVRRLPSDSVLRREVSEVLEECRASGMQG